MRLRLKIPCREDDIASWMLHGVNASSGEPQVGIDMAGSLQEIPRLAFRVEDEKSPRLFRVFEERIVLLQLPIDVAHPIFGTGDGVRVLDIVRPMACPENRIRDEVDRDTAKLYRFLHL